MRKLSAVSFKASRAIENRVSVTNHVEVTLRKLSLDKIDLCQLFTAINLGVASLETTNEHSDENGTISSLIVDIVYSFSRRLLKCPGDEDWWDPFATKWHHRWVDFLMKRQYIDGIRDFHRNVFKEETIELTKKMKNNIPGAVSRSRRFRSPGPRWVEVKFEVKLNFFSPQCHYCIARNSQYRYRS